MEETRESKRQRREGKDALEVLPGSAWLRIGSLVEPYDRLAFGLTCRTFLEAVRTREENFKEKGKDSLLRTDLRRERMFERLPRFTLGWYKWVSASFKRKRGRRFLCDLGKYKTYLSDCDLLFTATFQGSVDATRWLVSQGVPLRVDKWKCCEGAEFGGNIELLSLFKSEGHAFESLSYARAAYGGNLEAIKWLRKESPHLDWDSMTCTYAAEGGQLELLKWLRSQDPPCSWDEGTCAEAALNGQIGVLQWLRSQDPPCPWDSSVCSYAAEGGHLGILKWLKQQGWTMDGECCETAARGGFLETIQWLFSSESCEFSIWHCAEAGGGGHLHVLEWLRSQDPPCPWDENTCSDAALGGHLHTLQWLRSQSPPCPWDENTCSAAAKGGHLDVLQWARSQDPPCPSNEWTCRSAASGGHLHILKWLRSQNPPCPWGPQDCINEARENESVDISDWIAKNY
ncbi:hypothetical protein HOP50_10g59480 [Chloropicon primus]|uniref:Ankyrin repeat domain-containing protein n=1 Tax=Chloropicon primus TaxID=1764295 RepID=A0A5B8MS37_9CHLO|nr:hypothetical protein A3770_10p59270 [Chloropicon primus]UPR02621.1 hypothetical protein HOP50_10g59480 [Chloropicon primus]|eukprot:QDZ23409.1 hypothetical protein A3770_10p59270 [Chloropicon primus]